MEQSSVDWFIKHKDILKSLVNSILSLLNLHKVDSHTLILAVVVINQFYRYEQIKE